MELSNILGWLIPAHTNTGLETKNAATTNQLRTNTPPLAATDRYGCVALPPLQERATWNPTLPFFLGKELLRTERYEEPSKEFRTAKTPEEKGSAFREFVSRLIDDSGILCQYNAWQQRIEEQTDALAEGRDNTSLDNEVDELGFNVFRLIDDIERLAAATTPHNILGEEEYWVIIEELESRGFSAITRSYVDRINALRQSEHVRPASAQDADNKVRTLSEQYDGALDKGVTAWQEYNDTSREYSLQLEIVEELERMYRSDLDALASSAQVLAVSPEEMTRLAANTNASNEQLAIERGRLAPLEQRLQQLELRLAESEKEEKALSSAILEALVEQHGIKDIVRRKEDLESQVDIAEGVLSCYTEDGSPQAGCDRILESNYTLAEAEAILERRKNELDEQRTYLAHEIQEIKNELLRIRGNALGLNGKDGLSAASLTLSSTDHAQLADALVLAGARNQAELEYIDASKKAQSIAEERLYKLLAWQLDPSGLNDKIGDLQRQLSYIPHLREFARSWDPEKNNCFSLEAGDGPACPQSPGTPEQVEALNAVTIGALYDALAYGHDPQGNEIREHTLVGLEKILLDTLHARGGEASPLEAAVLMEDVDKVLFRYISKGGRLAQIRMSQDEQSADKAHQQIWFLVNACDAMIGFFGPASPDNPFTNRLVAQKWHLFVDSELNGFERPLHALHAMQNRIIKPHGDSHIVRTLLREFKLKNPDLVIAGSPNLAVDRSYTDEGRRAGGYALSSELVRSGTAENAGSAATGAGIAIGVIAAFFTEGLAIPFLIGGLGGGSAYAGMAYSEAYASPQYDEALKTGFSIHSALDYEMNMGSFGTSTFFAGLDSALWWSTLGKIGGTAGKLLIKKGGPKALAALRGASQKAKTLGFIKTARYLGASTAEGIGTLTIGVVSFPFLTANFAKNSVSWAATRATTWWQKFSFKAAGKNALRWTGKQFSKGHGWKTTRVLTGAGLTGADLFAIDDISLDENGRPVFDWGTDISIDTLVGTIGALMLISEGAQTLLNMPTGGTYVTAGFRAGTEQIMLKQQGLPLTTLDPGRLIGGVVESRTVEFFIASFIRGEEFLKEFKLGRLLLGIGKVLSEKVPGFGALTTSLIQRGDRGVVGWIPKREKARELRSVTVIEEQVGDNLVVKPLGGEIIQTSNKAPDGSLMVKVKRTGPDGTVNTFDVRAKRYKSGENMPEATRVFLAQNGIHISPENGRLFALNRAENLWGNGLGIKLKYKLQTVTIPADKLAKQSSPLPEKWRARVQKDGSVTVTNEDASDLPEPIRAILKSNGVLANPKDGLYTVGSRPASKVPNSSGSSYYSGLKLNFFKEEMIPDEVTVLKPAYNTKTTFLSGDKVKSMNDVPPSLRDNVRSELAARGIYVDESGNFFTLADPANRMLTGALVMPGEKAGIVYFDPKTGSYSTLAAVDPMGMWGKSNIPSSGAAMMALEKVPLASARIQPNPMFVRSICTGRDGKYKFSPTGTAMMAGYVAPIVGAFNFWLFAPAQGGDPSYQMGQRLVNYGITMAFTWPVIQWPLGFWTPQAEAAGRLVGIPVNVFANRMFPNKRNQFPGWDVFQSDLEANDFDSLVYGTDMGLTNFGGFLTQATSLNIIPSHVSGDHGEFVLNEFEGPALDTWREKMNAIITAAVERSLDSEIDPENLPQVRMIKNFALAFDNFFKREINEDLDTLTRRMIRIWAAYIKSTVVIHDPYGTSVALKPFRDIVIRYPDMFSKTPVLRSGSDWNEFIGKVNAGKDPAINFHIDTSWSVLTN